MLHEMRIGKIGDVGSTTLFRLPIFLLCPNCREGLAVDELSAAEIEESCVSFHRTQHKLIERVVRYVRDVWHVNAHKVGLSDNIDERWSFQNGTW